ncbi:FecCD family ABC transporter permease [Paenibacillus oralis]|uniref:FecCD family ABC transporter permease n=1 Tax=Paenibacillus oralis TaxID=2490856 RepID=UPI0015AD98A3|nr:iron ABC transporter permease [Paenibacillus oralis]
MTKNAQITYEGDIRTDHKHLKQTLLFILLIVIMLLASAWSMTRGAVSASPKDVWDALQNPGESATYQVIYEMRLPNVLAAIFGGMGLAASGVILQRVMRHPLPDPGTMGMTGGGAFVISLAALYISDFSVFHYFVASIIGSIVTSGIVWFLASRVKRGSMAIRSMFAGTLILLIIEGSVRLIAQNTDNLISLWYAPASGIGWSLMNWLIPWFAIGLFGAFTIVFARPATELGKKLIKILPIIVVIELSAGVALAFGAIAFVGTLVPLLVRRWVSKDDRWVLPISVILGAILMVVIGVVNRTLIAPIELPWNFIVSIVGAPIMIYLLCRNAVKEANFKSTPTHIGKIQ